MKTVLACIATNVDTDRADKLSKELTDLGDATRETKGYNFDLVAERIPLDKKYDYTALI